MAYALDITGGLAAQDRLRAFAVPGDNMEPTVRQGDFLLVAPVQDYRGDGIYVVVDALGGLVPYRVEADPRGGLVMYSDNGRYERRALTLEDFRGQVAGKAAVVANVVDRRLIGDAIRGAAGSQWSARSR